MVRVFGVLRVPDGETESQVIPPLDPEALTENLTVLEAVTETDCCWIVVLPAVAVNDNDVGENEKVVPPCSAQAEGIPSEIIASSRVAQVAYL